MAPRASPDHQSIKVYHSFGHVRSPQSEHSIGGANTTKRQGGAHGSLPAPSDHRASSAEGRIDALLIVVSDGPQRTKMSSWGATRSH